MIKVLHKALDILEYISNDKERQYSLTEIAQAINEKPTTCSNIVQTLLERGYIERAGKRGYKLGVMAYSIVNMSGYHTDLVNAAKEPIKRLADHIEADAVLSVLKNKRKHVLIRVDSDSVIRVNSSSLDISDPYKTSTGLLLLAYEQEAVVTGLIKLNGIPPIFTSQEEYFNFLGSVRTDGFISMTVKKEIAEVAVPITVDGNVIAAIGVYMPKYKFTADYKKSVIESILKTSSEISSELVHLILL